MHHLAAQGGDLTIFKRNCVSMQQNKVYWASRRGMLELDLVLMPFAEKIYPSLSEENKRRYQHLLDQEDQDLFAWFLGRQEPSDPELKLIVDQVLAATAASVDESNR